MKCTEGSWFFTVSVTINDFGYAFDIIFQLFFKSPNTSIVL